MYNNFYNRVATIFSSSANTASDAPLALMTLALCFWATGLVFEL